MDGSNGSLARGNTKSRAYILTINNYTNDDFIYVQNICTNLAQTETNFLYIVGKEIAPSTGTPHLQCYIRFNTQRYFNRIKQLFPTAHIEAAKGTPKQNYTYCSKEGDFITNMDFSPTNERPPPIDPLDRDDIILRPFQKQVFDLLSTTPDERKIYWFWEHTGNIGKTSLAKSLCIRYPNEVLFVGGKANDIKYAVISFLQKKEHNLKMAIFHYTRSNEDYVSYDAIESIKDGIFFSAKYESGMCIYDTPHIVCFANFRPDITKLSQDRWEIIQINNTDDMAQ